MMRKLFILEDDPNAMTIVDWIKSKPNLNVVHARTVEDAVYYLEYCDDAPIESYSYFLFDASVPGASVPSVTGEDLNFFAEDGLNGVLVFNQYRNKIINSGAKVAFMTAFSSQIKEREDTKGINIIGKASKNFITDLSKFLA